MKLVRKFAIYCAIVLALIAFILLLATPAVTVNGYTLFEGVTAIFGDKYLKPIGVALAAWILLLIALLCSISLAVLPFIKSIKLSKKIVALLGCLTAIILLVSAILAFCPTAELEGGTLGGGWIVGGILLILAAVGIACDPVLTLLDK